MINAEYRCLDCGEIFDNRVQAIIHHMETKHQNFEVRGCGLKMTVKS
jgi:DNA-directed RNA polymerase subunit RPC12/RpoP